LYQNEDQGFLHQHSEGSEDNLPLTPGSIDSQRQSSLQSMSKLKSNLTSTSASNSSGNGKGSMTRGPWTKEEDATLFDMVSKLGPERWVVIAKELGTRNGKQCRERWHNHLDPSINKSAFTPDEDAKIWHLFHSLGPRWALMAKEMPGRPDNSIKNHFNTVLRPRRIFKKQEAESLAAAQNRESPAGFTPSVDHHSDSDKPKLSESNPICEIQSTYRKRKNNFPNIQKNLNKKRCKKQSEQPMQTVQQQAQTQTQTQTLNQIQNTTEVSSLATSPWPVSNYSFHPQLVEETPNLHSIYSYQPTHCYPDSFTPPNLYNPFTMTSLSYQNIHSPIPKVLTMDEPDWDFLQQLGNELGLPLNLN